MSIKKELQFCPFDYFPNHTGQSNSINILQDNFKNVK